MRATPFDAEPPGSGLEVGSREKALKAVSSEAT
jgi:hypothetical protein